MKQLRKNTIFKILRITFTTLSAIVMCIASSGGSILALTDGDVEDIIRKGPLYNQEEAGCGTNVVGTGTLPAIIPEPYNGAFTAAGQKYNVSPALVAALFTEENFTHTALPDIPGRWQKLPQVHPDPNSGWPVSPKNAQGPFQFLPTTWYGHGPQDPAAPWDPTKASRDGYGADGNGDGARNPQHLLDGAFSAANYVAHNGATVDKPVTTWRNAIFAYNHADWYVDAVLVYYNYYNTGAPADASENANPPPSQPACGSAAAVDCSGTDTSGASTEVRSKVVCIAQDELARWNSGELKPGSGYKKYSQGRAENWCADFVSWVYNQAGYPLREGDEGNVPAVSTIKAIGEENGKFHWHPVGSYTPRPGDLVIHKENGSSHVNMVTAVSGAKLTIIGGNQARNGFNISFVSQYNVSDLASDDISGFVSPD